MRFLSLIGFSIVSLIQFAVITAVYWVAALLMYMFVSPHMPGYYEDAGLRDTLVFLVLFLTWDRYFGPYSKLLRDTAKLLYSVTHNQEED